MAEKWSRADKIVLGIALSVIALEVLSYVLRWYPR